MAKPDYRAKRSFDRTPEPAPAVEGNVDPGTAPAGESFVIHQHHATRLHFDLRLEMMNGDVPVLVSWAVPKNLPRNKGERHLAVHVEDHPFDYGGFSGTIPAGNYGAGEVRIFDRGTYELLEQEPGKLTFRLKGERLPGVWHMVKIGDADKPDWLVFLRGLERDDPAPLKVIEPMNATLAAGPFDDDGWIFEPKWDGIRATATCVDQTVLISRNLNDITKTYPELHKVHERLVALEAVLDGEIVSLAEGRPSFERLQQRMNLQNVKDIERISKKIPVAYIAFDLLYLDGEWLLDKPIEERKELLEATLIPDEHLQVSTSVRGDGISMYEIAEGNRMEGVVAKKLGTPYRPGVRSKEWLKIKTTHMADVVIGGWTPGQGGRSNSFGSLLLGAYDEGGLRFVGSVGTGFDDKALTAMLGALEDLASQDNPFSSDPRSDKARWGRPIVDPRWVEPVLVAKVEFRELTSAGRLRAPSFKGIRTDKDPEDCLFEDLLPSEGPNA